MTKTTLSILTLAAVIGLAAVASAAAFTTQSARPSLLARGAVSQPGADLLIESRLQTPRGADASDTGALPERTGAARGSQTGTR
jgi:hypothetical protein